MKPNFNILVTIVFVRKCYPKMTYYITGLKMPQGKIVR
jgi:hypothetical protein